MPTASPREKRLLLIKLAIAAVVLLVGAALVLRGVDLRAWLERGLDLVRRAGPLTFFAAMAILPAFGAPILAFSLSAGPAFSEQLGVGWVIACSMLALAINMALTYWLASRALRPLLQRLVTRLGYKLPEVDAADATNLIVLLRVTPGVPFCVQNYLLGLARVPFGRYLAISCAVQWGFNAAIVFFGNALLTGHGYVAFVAFSVFLALVAATQLVRRHFAKKKVS